MHAVISYGWPLAPTALEAVEGGSMLHNFMPYHLQMLTCPTRQRPSHHFWHTYLSRLAADACQHTAQKPPQRLR